MQRVNTVPSLEKCSVQSPPVLSSSALSLVGRILHSLRTLSPPVYNWYDTLGGEGPEGHFRSVNVGQQPQVGGWEEAVWLVYLKKKYLFI